jgi:hypothetical protein
VIGKRGVYGVFRAKTFCQPKPTEAVLASYGSQANDQTLVHMALKIQARAIRKLANYCVRSSLQKINMMSWRGGFMCSSQRVW